MQQDRASANRPSVVPRSDIPVSGAPEDTDLEVRPFNAHALLSEVVPRSDVALAWTHARPGQEVSLRSHATPGLLIILDGGGELFGRVQRRVEQGDVITVPRGQEYGFRAIGAQGLHALHVAFGDDPNPKVEEAMSLEHLVARNEARAKAALNSPFFLLLQDANLKSPKKRVVLREALRVFSDAFQTMLFTRQASCRDDSFRDTFHAHLVEELGHNKLLEVAGVSQAASDPVLRAASAWFCHQMLVMDNSAKSIVNLVLETAGYYFHNLASPVFASDESAKYFASHAEDDEHHKEVGMDLLRDLHPENYRRLYRVLEDSWDMFDVMTTRIARLVELEETRS